jgi:hypothetical protein
VPVGDIDHTTKPVYSSSAAPSHPDLRSEVPALWFVIAEDMICDVRGIISFNMSEEVSSHLPTSNAWHARIAQYVIISSLQRPPSESQPAG